MASYVIMNVEVSYQDFFPKIYESIVVNTTRNQALIRLNVSKEGMAFCDVYDNSSSPVSPAMLRSSVTVPLMLHAGLNELLVSSLAPDTSYNLYCYTEDELGYGMDQDDILITKLSLKTSCCRTVRFTKFPTSLHVYSSSSATADPLFNFEVSTRPELPLTVKMSVSSGRYCGGESGRPDNPTFFPSSVVITENSYSLGGSFVVRGLSPGCFTIKLYTDQFLYEYDERPLEIKAANSPITPPALIGAFYSDEGDKIFLSFDSESSLSSSFIGVKFPCLEVFNLTTLAPDVSVFFGLQCLWRDSSSIAVVGSAVAQTDLQSRIYIKTDAVEICQYKSKCAYSNFTKGKIKMLYVILLFLFLSFLMLIHFIHHRFSRTDRRTY